VLPPHRRDPVASAVSSVYRTISLVSRLPIGALAATQSTSPCLRVAKGRAGVTQITSPLPVSGLESLAIFS